MKNDLTCEVVQDLLPSYVDGLTSDVSNQAVEQHMKTCESCRKLYSEMREPMNGEDVSEINDGQKADSKKSSEIDYLKSWDLLPENAAPVPDWDCDKGHGIWNLDIPKPDHEWSAAEEWPEEENMEDEGIEP